MSKSSNNRSTRKGLYLNRMYIDQHCQDARVDERTTHQQQEHHTPFSPLLHWRVEIVDPHGRLSHQAPQWTHLDRYRSLISMHGALLFPKLELSRRHSQQRRSDVISIEYQPWGGIHYYCSYKLNNISSGLMCGWLCIARSM